MDALHAVIVVSDWLEQLESPPAFLSLFTVILVKVEMSNTTPYTVPVFAKKGCFLPSVFIQCLGFCVLKGSSSKRKPLSVGQQSLQLVPVLQTPTGDGMGTNQIKLYGLCTSHCITSGPWLVSCDQVMDVGNYV